VLVTNRMIITSISYPTISINYPWRPLQSISKGIKG